MKKILFAGESWTSFTTHVKGFDTFYTSVYEEGIEFIEKAIKKAGYEMVYIPGHHVAERFPKTKEELQQYDCVVLSDVGANTLLLSSDTFSKSIRTTNRCDEIREYVLDGGSLLMIGGYMTFTGIDGKARYGQTAVQDVLPVQCLERDDRCEHPEGIYPAVDPKDPVLQGLDNWPHFLGYNRTLPKAEAAVAATVNGDPLVAYAAFGKGRSAAFTSDCAPHWGPPEFVEWDQYDQMWKQIFDYLTA